MHVSHWQAAVQAWVPPIPQAWLAPGAQTPSPAQAPQSDQTPLLQVRAWVPQLPQAWVIGPAQGWPMQAFHWQVALQVWLPPIPQAWLAPGAQAPSFVHAPQADQTPLVQVRAWVPQLPQAWVIGPVQLWPPQAPH
jgi:hypothetical protein